MAEVVFDLGFYNQDSSVSRVKTNEDVSVRQAKATHGLSEDEEAKINWGCTPERKKKTTKTQKNKERIWIYNDMGYNKQCRARKPHNCNLSFNNGC